jgi:molecular chaperone GrpE
MWNLVRNAIKFTDTQDVQDLPGGVFAFFQNRGKKMNNTSAINGAADKTVPNGPALSGSVELQEALAAQKDDYLRLAADFDNYKKRIRRDSEQQAASGKETIMRDLLPVVDNLERALACERSIASDQLRQGVEMTLQHLRRLLLHHGVEAVEDVGKLFDPHQHEAISVRRDPLQPDQIILEVAQRGYRRGDKSFRPARVIVNDTDYSAGGTASAC